MVLGITNYRNEDIKNVNLQIIELMKKVKDLHVFIFHDNVYEGGYIKGVKVITENKNMGTLYGRIEVINNIPPEFDNDFLVWLDADDEVQDIDKLLRIIDECKDYDWVASSIQVKCCWCKFVKIGVYKKIIEKIKLTPGLRMRTSECNIITAALIDMYNKHEISFISHDIGWIKVNGCHQTFQIERDFYDDRLDNLKADLEDLIQWFIWIEIDKPGFDLSVENCDHFYKDNIGKIKELKKLDKNKFIKLIAEILKNIPAIYRNKISIF